MNNINPILDAVVSGEMSVEDAAHMLRALPYKPRRPAPDTYPEIESYDMPAPDEMAAIRVRVGQGLLSEEDADVLAQALLQK